MAVIGASGYGGLQTIRLLLDHPEFEITFLGGERSSGKSWSDVNPFIPIPNNLTIEIPDPDKIAQVSDFAVLSMPNGRACQIVPHLVKRNVRVIDLSADYRFRSLDKWNSVYLNESRSINRKDTALCETAVYGLPEWNCNAIRSADIVAAPGCFPTASLLPLLPFLNQGMIEYDGIIIDAKTGTSGGGRSPKENLLLSESSETISPYGVIGHRHTPEIEQMASHIAGQEINIQFTPHLVPMVRGLLSTVYAKLRDPGLTSEDCRTVLATIYRNNQFVEVLPVGVYPSTKWVRNTNKAFLSVQVDTRTSGIVLMTAIDNLIKGQAGQGVQCLNIMAGLSEDSNLPTNTYYP